LSRNLLKASRLIKSDSEPVIINSNEMMLQKMERLRYLFDENSEDGEGFSTDGFHGGLKAQDVELLLEDEESAVIRAPQPPPEPVYTGPTPEELIAEAEAEIARMQADAKKQAEALRSHAQEEGRKAGYDEGHKKAMLELDKEKQKLQSRQAQLEQEYQSLIDRLEPLFIETLTNIYEEIFKVDLVEYKSILQYLITHTIRTSDGYRDFLVHVSRDDFVAVTMAREEILSELMSPGITMEIIEDATLKVGECMIETGSGIFDCGLGTQLAELKKRLRLLSYENVKD